MQEGTIKEKDDAGGHYKKVEMVQEVIIKGRDDAGGRYKRRDDAGHYKGEGWCMTIL